MRTMAPMKPVMKLTCNPDYSSFLRVWLQQAGYLDEDNYGIPKPEMDGVEKYFIRQGNEMIWSDSREELLETYGEDAGVTSFRFISATCQDNPVLLEHDKGYVSRLKALPRIERMRLLDGAWLVQESAAGYYKKEWTSPVSLADVPELTKIVRAYDLAGSVPSEKYPDPDYTVGTLMGECKEGNIYVLDIKRFRKRYAGVLEEIIETGLDDMNQWGNVMTYIPEDPSSAGKAACQSMLHAIGSAGVPIKKMKTSNVKNRKLKAFEPFAVAAENNMVYVVVADWNDTFHEELELFDPSVRVSGLHDDIVDATADAYQKLKSERIIRAYSLPDCSSSTKYTAHKQNTR